MQSTESKAVDGTKVAFLGDTKCIVVHDRLLQALILLDVVIVFEVHRVALVLKILEVDLILVALIPIRTLFLVQGRHLFFKLFQLLGHRIVFVALIVQFVLCFFFG